MEIQKPRGTSDFVGKAQEKRSKVLETFTSVCRYFNFEEISTPMFEQKDLYVRSVGDETDLVSKELFELENKSENVYVLRPELTAGIVRALVEGGVRGRILPIMYYSVGEFFRYDKPQKGRYRQAGHLDVEIFGLNDPAVDIMLISSISMFFKKLNIEDKVVFNINTLGSAQTKKEYGEKLVGYLKENKKYLCLDCQKRMGKNPLRVLDCKEDQCKKIAASGPSIYDSLNTEEKDYFNQIMEGLEILKIPFVVDPTLVRGLDYYTGLIFEINLSDDKDRKLSLGGGGRYDGLVEQLGGPSLSACGYALGIERVTEFLNFKIESETRSSIKVIIVPTSVKQKNNVLLVQSKLSDKKNVTSYAYFKNSSLSDALSFASKNDYDYAIIAGDEEAQDDKYILKNLKENSQETLSLGEILKDL